MDREQVLKWAREAGLMYHIPFPSDSLVDVALCRFVAIATAAAKSEEREACAQACENLTLYGPVAEVQQRYNLAYRHCSAAIRARGNP